MTARKTPILLRRAPMSGRVMALHRYTSKTVRGREVLAAAFDGKQDVQDDFETLALQWLMDGGAENIVEILDGAALGYELTEDERAQIRVVRERLREACERHNERTALVTRPGGTP